MKRLIITLASGLFLAVPMGAQNNNTSSNTDHSLSTKMNKFWKKTKKTVSKTAENMKNELFSKDYKDLTEIDGEYYMPLYDMNLYEGQDGEGLKATCRALFEAKYPDVKVTACALPQKGWIKETTKNDDKVTGYVRTMYCYILAKDGTDGYINAKFCFSESKKVGHSYIHSDAEWPKWERTDILSEKVFDQLVKK
jgi:hypothetical protein